MYSIENLKYKNILNINNLDINQTTPTFITGKSGSGKSTLLKLLLGIDKTYQGTIFYKSKNLNEIEENVLRNDIGYLSQHHVFYKQTIKEEFAYIQKLLCIESSSFREYLDIVHLDYEENTSISILSGGEKQRLALARLLFTNKSVLLLDEPTSSLDLDLELQVIDSLIQEANNKNIKLIIITHNKDLLSKYDFQNIIIEDGMVISNES